MAPTEIVVSSQEEPVLSPPTTPTTHLHTRNRPGATVYAALAAGGAAGALARYGLAGALPNASGHFPFGTFAVNISGCLALGFLLVLLDERLSASRLARPFVATGFLGAYTTFSTFDIETLLLAHGGHWVIGAAYLAGSVVAGLGAAVLGIALARVLLTLADRRAG